MVALHQNEPDASERRVSQRVRTLKRAKLVFNGGFSTFDCIVRNMSSTGALLTIDESAHLPKEFEIRIGEEQNIRPAKLVYRRGLFAGVRFLDVEEDTHTTPMPETGAGSLNSSASMPKTHGTPQGPMANCAGIRRVEPELLPAALRAHFPWT